MPAGSLFFQFGDPSPGPFLRGRLAPDGLVEFILLPPPSSRVGTFFRADVSAEGPAGALGPDGLVEVILPPPSSSRVGIFLGAGVSAEGPVVAPPPLSWDRAIRTSDDPFSSRSINGVRISFSAWTQSSKWCPCSPPRLR